MSQPANILYVDDEDLSHILFKAVFEDHYNVFTAISAQDGIEILRRESIDVLITDQSMPEMTGAELLEAIHDEFPTIGRVMLTAYSDIDAIIQAINSGRIDRYVTKPWEEQSLRAVIDQALALHHQRIERQQQIDSLQQEIARERQLRQALQEHVPQEVLDELLSSESDSA
ncbi:MAG: response regulator [Acidobacteriota bacterium]